MEWSAKWSGVEWSRDERSGVEGIISVILTLTLPFQSPVHEGGPPATSCCRRGCLSPAGCAPIDRSCSRGIEWSGVKWSGWVWNGVEWRERKWSSKEWS